MRKLMLQKVLASLVTLAMLISMVPMTAFASTTPATENVALGASVKVYHGVNVDNGVPLESAEITSMSIGSVSDITNGDRTAHVYPGLIYSRFIYEIDLGQEVADINKVITSFVGDGTHGVPENYAVSVKSESDADWVRVAGVYDAENPVGITPVEHTFSNRAVRYVRVEGLTEGSRAMFMSEVEVYADPDVDIMPNVALGAPVTVLHTNGTPVAEIPANTDAVTDGSLTTYIYGGNSAWTHGYEIDLGEVKADLNEIRASFFKDGNHGEPLSYDAYISEDGVVWTKVGSAGGDNEKAITTTVFNFVKAPAQYVRIMSTSETGCAQIQRGMYMAEIEVYSNPEIDIKPVSNLALMEGTTAWGVDTATGVVIEPSDADAGARAELAINGSLADEAIPGVGHHYWDLVVKLPKAVEGVNTIKVYGSSILNQMPPNYSLLVSEDNVRWIPVKVVSGVSADATTYNTAPSYIEARFQNMKVQYVRFQDDTNLNFMRIAELEIYADANYVHPESNNLALYKEVKLLTPDGVTELPYVGNESSSEKHNNNATDGAYTTGTVAAQSYQWQAQVDLGEVKQGVNTVKVVFGEDVDNTVPMEFAVSVSADGVEWKTVKQHSFATKADREREVTVNFINADVQYVRVADGLAVETNSAGSQIQMQINEIEVYADKDVDIQPLTNYALGGVLKAYTNAGVEIPQSFQGGDFLFSYATDGDPATLAIPAKVDNPMDIEHSWDAVIELAEVAKDINNIIVTFHENGTPPSYKVEVSEDGINWYIVKLVVVPDITADHYNTNSIRKELVFPAKDVKFVRVSDIGTGNFMRIGEVELYSDPTLTPSVEKQNVALGQKGYLLRPNIVGAFDPTQHILFGTGADEEGNGGQHAGYAVDGNTNTVSCAGMSYQWTYQLDLGYLYDNINQIEVVFGNGTADATPQEYSVQYSEDGVEWVTIDEIRYDGPWAKEDSRLFSFEPTAMRYIRVNDLLAATYNANGDRIQMGIAELRAFPLYPDTPYEVFTSVVDGAADVSVSGKVEFWFNRAMPQDLVVTYKAENGADIAFAQAVDADNLGLTVKPNDILSTGTKYTLTLSSETAGLNESITFTTEPMIADLEIITEPTSKRDEFIEEAIYPAFVDGLHYQAWTMRSVKNYFQLEAFGGAGELTWTITDGKLPTGLTLTADGKISGTATEEGTFNFTVTVTDEQGNSVSKALDMIANPYRAKWHNEAKFGMMTQWGPFCDPSVTLEFHQNGTNTIADWEARASKFNPTGWAADMKAMGAEYFNFTVMGGDNIRLWPSTTPTRYELKTERNYVKELIDACHAQGIKFIAYLPGGGGWSGIFDEAISDSTVSSMHEGIIAELIEMGIDGLWVDSSGSVPGHDYNFNWDKIMPVIRTLKPDLLVGSNPVGMELGYAVNYPYTDYIIYEGHYRANVSDRVVAKWAQTTKKMSVEMTALHQAQWAYVPVTSGGQIAGSMNSADHIITNIRNNWANGVTYTAATPAPIDGSSFMDAEARAQMTQVGAWVVANKDSAPFDVNRDYKDIATVVPNAVEKAMLTANGAVNTIAHGDIENYDSYAGVQITASTTPVTITQLGRYVVDGNNGVHKLRLVERGFRYEGFRVIREVELDLATATVDADGFAYVEIEPVTLKPGTSYYVLSRENSDDAFATPNLSAMSGKNGVRVIRTAWSDLSGTRIYTPVTTYGEYTWPYMVDTHAVKNGGLVNFKAVVGNTPVSDNLALGAITTITDLNNVTIPSGSYIHPSEMAVDGDKSTYIEPNETKWIVNVDLGRIEQIDTIKVKFLEGYYGYLAKSYQLFASRDGQIYALLAEKTNNWDASVVATFPSSEVRYIRFVTVESHGSGRSLITEIEAYSSVAPTPDAPDPQVTLSGTASVDGWAVTEWSDDANTVAVNVADAQGFTSTITVDGTPYTSGSDIVLTAEGKIEVVVTTAKEGYNTVTNTYTITVPAKTLKDATAPTVTLAGTATVEGWNVTEWSDDANTVAVNVVDAEGFTSTITVNGEAYVAGSDIVLTAEGTIEVVVTTSAEGYNTVTNTYTITVPAKTEPEVPQVIGSEVYTIADGFIRKIEVGTTVNELLENVTPAGGTIKVYKSETATAAMRGTVAVGTGNVVKLFDANGDVVDSLTVVILGDVSGDGKINATDLISLVAYIGGSREYTEAQTIAANLMQPARPTINAQDLGYLKDAINGSKTIVQK